MIFRPFSVLFLGIFSAACVMPLSRTWAATLVYESFDYTVGSELNGQSGGTGFGSYSWSDSSAPGNRDTVSSGSLAYGSLATAGNSALAVSPTYALTSSVTRRFTNISGTAGTTTWVSFLFALEHTAAPLTTGDYSTLAISAFTPPGPNGTAHFGIFNDPDGEPGDKVFGIGSSQITAASLSNVPLVAHQTYFLVARIDWNAGTTPEDIYLYINPAMGGPEPSLGSAAAYSNSVNISLASGTSRLSSLGIYAGEVGPEWAYDEIRIGSTFADVTPIPEPTAGACVLAAGVFLWWRKRK